MYSTLDEAIDHAEEITDDQKKKACNLYDAKNYEASRECIWCAEEHSQLAEWLKDYKRLLEQESILDKIVTEIESMERYGTNNGHDVWLRTPEEIKKEVLNIIDKYRD